MTNPIQQSKGIPPSEYTRFLERQFAEHEAFIARRHKERLVRRLTWACWVSVAVVIGVAAYVGWCA